MSWPGKEWDMVVNKRTDNLSIESCQEDSKVYRACGECIGVYIILSYLGVQ